MLSNAHLHSKIWPALFGQPLDCTSTLPKASHFRCRGPVLWLGSCSNGHLVDFQLEGTLRHSDLLGEDVLGSEATTELSLISFPSAERETRTESIHCLTLGCATATQQHVIYVQTSIPAKALECGS